MGLWGGWIGSFQKVPGLAVGRDRPLPRTRIRLERQQFSADLGPSEPGRAPDQILALRFAKPEFPHPGVFLQVATRHRDALRLLHQNVFDRLAGEVGDLALEITNTGLARVIANQIANAVVADAPLVLTNAVRGHLLRD